MSTPNCRLPWPRLPWACLLAMLLIAPAAALATSSLDGAWVLNEDLSVDPEDAFDDMLKRDSYPVPYAEPGSNQARSPRDASQTNYWDTVRDGRERHSLKNLQRLGSIYPLVMAQRLDIAIGADGHLDITYDEALPRELFVNPNGRVFSAKGDELVGDSIGFTLAYWDGDTLVIETDPPDGGKVAERLRVGSAPRRLEYVLEVEMRILAEPVEFKRVLEPVDGRGN